MTSELTKPLRLLTHAAARIESASGFVVYLDPYNLVETPHDADLILVTHDHFDHLSSEDVAKVAKPDGQTAIVLPRSIVNAHVSELADDLGLTVMGMDAGETMDPCAGGSVMVDAIAAYNVGKHFHPKENGWLGYVVVVDGVRFFHMGDTDQNPDNEQVACDVLLIPVGGTYTMDVDAAVACTLAIAPKVAVPMHYGSVAGNAADGQRFCDALAARTDAVESLVLMER